MTVVSDTTIGGGTITLDKRANRRFFQNTLSVISKKRTKYSREALDLLPAMSSLPEAADAWALLSGADQTAWNTAASYCNKNGFNLFLQDKTYRIINSLAGNATPSNNHQYLVGHINIPIGSGHFLLRQVGNDAIPNGGSLNISYKTDLTADGGPGEYLKVRFSYRWDDAGTPTFETAEITLNLSQAWTITAAEFGVQDTPLEYWQLEIEGDKIKGDFWFDNFYAEVGGSAYTFDRDCQKVDKKFFQLVIPVGVVVESIYPAD